MHNIFELFGIQFFAEGVSGEGDSAVAAPGETAVAAGQYTGDNAAAAGQTDKMTRSLEELGVPKDKAEKYRARKARTASTEVTAAPEETAQAEAPQAAAAETAQTENTTTAPDWDELMKNPEINRKMQDIVKARLKPVQTRMDSLAPMLELLGKKYGVDTSDISKLDIGALAKAVGEDNYFYEESSEELGTDISTAKKNVQRELELNAKDRELRRKEEEFSNTIEEMMTRRIQEKQESEAIALKRKFPDFDLEAEKQNPRFAAMISPAGGMTVEGAYWAIHHEELSKAIEEKTAQTVVKSFSNSIQAGRRIPAENGANSKSGAPLGVKLYSQMNKAEREAWKNEQQRASIHRR